MDADCLSLSIKDRNGSISAKKKKKKVLKNVLLPSKAHLFRCLKTSSDNFDLQLETLLPHARIWDQTEDNKEIRKAARNSLCLGVNAVNRELLKKNICGVLFTLDVNPEALVSHVIQRCCHNGVPMLKVEKLRTITYNALGFECIALGFKKPLSVFKDLVKLAYYETNITMIEEVILVNNIKNDNIMLVEKNMCNPDATADQADVSVVFLEEKPQERVFEYFKRIDNSQRSFSPEKYNEEHGLLEKPCDSNKGFILIQNQTFSFDDTAEQGISSSVFSSKLIKQKRQKLKKYVPAKVLKLGSNLNRKKNK